MAPPATSVPPHPCRRWNDPHPDSGLWGCMRYLWRVILRQPHYPQVVHRDTGFLPSGRLQIIVIPPADFLGDEAVSSAATRPIDGNKPTN